MQFLLTETEMEAIDDERRIVAEKLPGRSLANHLEALKNVCQGVATTMLKAEPGARPHGCIHVPDERGRQWQTQYCDNCPVAGICPQPKDYSK